VDSKNVDGFIKTWTVYSKNVDGFKKNMDCAQAKAIGIFCVLKNVQKIPPNRYISVAKTLQKRYRNVAKTLQKRCKTLQNVATLQQRCSKLFQIVA
jgi:hypothetical protein